MSAPKKEITKLSEQGVVTQEALLAYLNNELPAGKMQEMENLLKDDPFAQDALEGLRESQDKTALAGSLSSLNKQVRERTGLKEAKGIDFHWSNYAWAAVVFGILIGVGFLMVNYLGKPKNDIAANGGKEKSTEVVKQMEEQKPESINAAPATADTVQVHIQAAPTGTATGTTGTVAATNTTTQPLATGQGVQPVASAASGKVNAAPAQSVPPQVPSQAANKPAVANNAVSPAANMNSTLTANNNFMSATPANTGPGAMGKPTAPAPALAKEEVAKEKATVNTEKRANADDKGRSLNTQAMDSYKAPDKDNGTSTLQSVTRGSITEKEPAEKPTVISMEEAMKGFNTNDYKKAAQYFDAILKQDPDNVDALYFGGISDYIEGRTAKSEKNFDKLIKKGSKYVDGAKWYKANILLKKGNREEAKTLLQELANSGGSYKERAVKKLADLSF